VQNLLNEPRLLSHSTRTCTKSLHTGSKFTETHDVILYLLQTKASGFHRMWGEDMHCLTVSPSLTIVEFNGLSSVIDHRYSIISNIILELTLTDINIMDQVSQ